MSCECHDKVVNFDTMKNMVSNHEPMPSEERFTFKWDAISKHVISNYISRSVKSTICETKTIVGYDTVAFGYAIPNGFEDKVWKNIFNWLYKMDDKVKRESTSIQAALDL